MKNFTITLAPTYSDKFVKLDIQASCYDAADALGEALAELMPQEDVYFDKSDRDITVDWTSNTEEKRMCAEKGCTMPVTFVESTGRYFCDHHMSEEVQGGTVHPCEVEHIDDEL